jgi:hypothetical protein
MADPPSLASFVMRAKPLNTGILSSGAPTWKEKLVHAQYKKLGVPLTWMDCPFVLKRWIYSAIGIFRLDTIKTVRSRLQELALFQLSSKTRN